MVVWHCGSVSDAEPVIMRDRESNICAERLSRSIDPLRVQNARN